MASGFADMQPRQLRRYIRRRKEGRYLLIDVRQPAEYEQGHIPGARLMPVMELVRDIHKLPAGRELIFYCRTGSRSAAAATLAAEELGPDCPIFNLAGGFMAWDGGRVEGRPQVKLFELHGSVDANFQMAMDLEKGALRFYTYLAARLGDQTWAAVFEELARAEKAHARTVYGHWQKQGRVAEDFDTLFGRLAGEIIEGGRPLVDVLQQAVGIEKDRCIRLLELALEVENAAFDLYRTLSDQFDDEDCRQAFVQVAQAEKAHMETLLNGFSLCRK